MKINNLGRSGLRVSELCLGTMTFGGKGFYKDAGSIKLTEAKKIVIEAIDNGINFFDTADIYSFGASEEMLGKALGKKRDEVVICTKAFFNKDKTPNKKGSSRKHIIEACEASLKRLNTEYIDVYIMHAYDINTPLDETLSAMDDLIRWGKVRYIGCSNYTAWQLMKALSISDVRGLERFSVTQSYYSIVSRELENEIIPLCLDQNLGITLWSPLAGGFLTGEYRKDNQKKLFDKIKNSPFIPQFDVNKGFEIIEKLDEIAKNRNVDIAQVAINYIASKKGITSVIFGIQNIKQLKDNISTVGWDLDEEEIKILDEVSEPPELYPHWYQNRINNL